MSRDDVEKLLTAEDVASILQVTPRTVKSLRLRREIAFVRMGRHIRFRPADVDAFVDKRLVEAKR